MEIEFWQFMERLVKSNFITIDRKKGSSPPRIEQIKYPVDYGFLDGTSSVDGTGVDIWLGSRSPAEVDGCFVTVDLEKSDCEVKITLGCLKEEIRLIQAFHNSGGMSAKYINRWEIGKK